MSSSEQRRVLVVAKIWRTWLCEPGSRGRGCDIHLASCGSADRKFGALQSEKRCVLISPATPDVMGGRGWRKILM
jgi:hypothetical protein